MKVWVTAHLFKLGITEHEAELDAEHPMAVRLRNHHARYGKWIFKPYWHATREEAIAWAEKYRNRRIQDYEDKINKMKEVDFWL